LLDFFQVNFVGLSEPERFELHQVA
jgi:hypothetical protein